MSFFNGIKSMVRILDRIKTLLHRTKELVDQSPRPTDALPIDAVVPIFVIHPDHLDGWESRVHDEIWQRLSIFQPHIVEIWFEEVIQGQPHALDRKELADLHAGIPVLRMPVPLRPQARLPKGGRKKDVTETALRKAMAFEVYRRDIEIRAIEALQAKKDGRLVNPTDIPKISTLASMVWVKDFPQKKKGRKVEANRAGNGPANADAWCAVFYALLDEGRKLAVERAVGAKEPKEVESAIISDLCNHDVSGLTQGDFDAAFAEVARHVELLMRAYRHATRAAELKYDLSQRLRKHLEKLDGRRTKPYHPVQVEIVTKREHIMLTQNNFTAKELAEVAFLADIDVNLLCTSHMLASPEFGIARKLGRWRSGKVPAFDAREAIFLNRFVLQEHGGQSSSMYAEVHELLAEYALEIMPLGAWRKRLATRTNL